MRACVVRLAVALVAIAPAARAAPRTSSLSWVRMAGADTCVSTQDLARDVEARLGRPVFVSAAQADLSVEGRIEPARPGWRAVVVLRDAKGATLGTRELVRPDASCQAMREPLALIVALMIDPDAPPPKAPAPAPPPPPAPPPKPETIVVEKRVPVYVPVSAPGSDEPKWHLDVGASLAGSVGLLPRIDPGVTASVLVEPPWLFPVEGYASLWVDSVVDGGPRLALAYVGGGLCPLHLAAAPLRLYACGSGQLGYVEPSSHTAAQAHVAGALELRGSLVVLGPIAVRAGGTLAVPLLRPSFDYTDAQTGAPAVYRMAPVAATVDLGLGLVMP